MPRCGRSSSGCGRARWASTTDGRSGSSGGSGRHAAAVVVPVVLTFANARPAARGASLPSAKVEAAILAACVLGGGAFVFNDAWHPHVPLSHALVPILAWAAIRFGVRGVSLANLGVTLLGAAFTAHGVNTAVESELTALGQVNRLSLFSVSRQPPDCSSLRPLRNGPPRWLGTATSTSDSTRSSRAPATHSSWPTSRAAPFSTPTRRPQSCSGGRCPS